jgi:hypothetical protein
MAIVADFDPNTPSIARVYDYLLDGKDNFAVDREGRGFGSYSSGVTQVHNHSVADFASFFGPLELVPPGVVDAREWRPDWEQAVHLPPRDGQAIVGVARVG